MLTTRLVLPAILFFAIAHSAVVIRDIPVAVIYDKDAELNKNAHFGSRNLQEKVQLSPEEIKQIPATTTNLDEKVQLSGDELPQVLKHLPLQESVSSDNQPSQLQLLDQAQTIIFDGIKALRLKFDKADTPRKPSNADWERLNANLENLISEQYKKLQLKQDAGAAAPPPPTGGAPPSGGNQIMNNILTGLSNITTIFMNNLQQSNRPPAGSEDEQQPQQPAGIWANLVTNFQGGVNQMINNINNLSGQTTSAPPGGVSGDTGTSSPPNNVFSNVISSIQQVFQGANNQGNPLQGIGLNQSDTGTGGGGSTSPGNGNVFSGVIQSITNVITGQTSNNNNNNNKPEDEGSPSSTAAPGVFQNIGNAILGVINRPQGGSGGASGGTNPVSSGAQAVNNQISQLVGSQSGASPVESIQNAIAAVVPSSTEKSKTQPEASIQKEEVMQTAE